MSRWTTPALLSKALWLLLPCGVVAAGWHYTRERPGADVKPQYRTATVEKKDLVVSISASGTIEPEEIVDVGAQVAGKITAFGTEQGTGKAIDYGSPVEPGTILARIDDDLYREEVELAKADLAQAQSQLAQSQTSVQKATADLHRAEAEQQHQESKLRQAQRERRRIEDLQRKNAIANQEAETAESLVEQLTALVVVSQAAIEQAQASLRLAQASVTEKTAGVARAEALLRKAETNLGYTTIQSPIRGVIVDRRVNIGQTVVSNLNAPSLFLIAKDLQRIEVWASVNEADIGSIRVEMPVQFTVDAFRNELFHGTVKQIRLNATMAQSVVTYTVVVSVDNSTGKLLPYLTASLRFMVAERKPAMTVPVAALRWKPSSERPARQSGGAPDSSVASSVWVLDDGTPRRVKFESGLTDGNDVEVVSGELREGMQVILGETVAPRSQRKNPFAPSLTQNLDR